MPEGETVRKKEKKRKSGAFPFNIVQADGPDMMVDDRTLIQELNTTEILNQKS